MAVVLEICPISSLKLPSHIAMRLWHNAPIAFLGIVANLINVRVFSHRRMRQTKTNWLLNALSFGDLGLLLANVGFAVLPAVAEVSQNPMLLQLYPYVLRLVWWTHNSLYLYKLQYFSFGLILE